MDTATAIMIGVLCATIAVGFAYHWRKTKEWLRANYKMQVKILRTVDKLREDIAKGHGVTIWPTDFEVVYIDGEPMAVKGTVDGKKFCCALKPDTICYATMEKVEE